MTRLSRERRRRGGFSVTGSETLSHPRCRDGRSLRPRRAASLAACLLAGSASSGDAQNFPSDAPERQAEHWVGTYEGVTDGRDARLIISFDRLDGQLLHLNLVLEDLERGETFRGPGLTNARGGGYPPHRMLATTLEEADGDGEIEVSLLLLHTWNTRHLSGRTEWRGQSFGMQFHQLGD